MNIERNEEILIRYLTGECTEEEKKLFNAMLEKFPELREQYAQLQKIWNSSDPKLEHQDEELAWSRFVAKAGIKDYTISKSRIPFNSYRYLRYAAVILLLLLPLFYLSGLFTHSEIPLNVLDVELGDRQNLTLSDGTKITLDAGSKLSYPEEFGSERIVYLNGEAYFEVTKNPDKPFVVFANQGEVKVLGTKFNIRSWSDINTVQLTVTEGKVSFANVNNIAKTVYLEKGQYSYISGLSTPSAPLETSTEQALSWLKNEKYFENATLLEVIAQFERWYKIDIRLSDESALNDTVTINLKNRSYKENLELLSLVTGLDVTYNGNLILMN